MSEICALKPIENILDLNRACYCLPINRDTITGHIISQNAHSAMEKMLAERENYFASTAVFINSADMQNMQAQINAIEDVVGTKAYQEVVFARTDKRAYSVQTGTKGAFMGYDFHMTKDGPRLIEVNSNAGGAFVVGAIERALGREISGQENLIQHMFEREWILAGRTKTLKTIAIVDENPQDQFHYPDMCLAATYMRERGYEVVIIDPDQLRYQDNTLYAGEKTIDLVYNRLTDFGLEATTLKNLRDAFEDDAVVVTPNPRHHALYADKRNLTLLSNQRQLHEWGVSFVPNSEHGRSQARVFRLVMGAAPTIFFQAKCRVR